MGVLKFLSALQRKVEPKEIVEKGLMFVDATINSRPSRSTLIDSGATHNFIANQEARRLGLTIGKDLRKMKDVNSEALPIVGVSKRVPFKIGDWTGELDLVVARMDGFDVVLGMEFLLEHKVIPMQLAKCLMITDRNPTVIPASIKQLATTEETVSIEIKEVLNSYVDIMPESLPQTLPPHRGIDHEIELIPGVKPPAKNAYRMAPPKLAELWKQLDELLKTGFIRPTNAP
ncbi:uncharacterized protein LOC111483236 [Cucurbita maxima]|uniref:Uncharacterized protein LOC111483236 n=1 Tax=Cucurbita maxima TaxID=3661 RepID=A0A6J1J429_CUCMA|nr:uncharacterized protein LOC111483236 [Cucurbita maxima]